MLSSSAHSVVGANDWDTYQGSIPSNNMWWENDVWGKGSLTNGTDYYQRASVIPAIFPKGAILEWNWPDANGSGDWAYGYPKILVGRSPSGDNPYSLSGPWGQKINTLSALTMTYDFSLGGNIQAVDILLDNFVHSVQNPTDLTTLVAELSYLPYRNVSNTSGTAHDFPEFAARVINNGASPAPQISVQPVTSSGSTTGLTIYSGTVDLLGHYNFMISQGWLTGNEYIQGLIFGAEPQQAASGISTVPHIGLLKINNLSYVWT